MGPASWAMPRSSTLGSRWGRSTVWTWINLVQMWSIWAGLGLGLAGLGEGLRVRLRLPTSSTNGQTAKRPNGQGRDAWPLRSG